MTFKIIASPTVTDLRSFFQAIGERFPILQKLFGVGWKVTLTEVLIEIPFLILESSFLMRFLFGITLGLTLWQYFVVAAALHLLIECGRWAFARFVSKSDDYQFWQHELELLQILRGWLHQRRKTWRNLGLIDSEEQ
ncbi:MAG: hypothetical protein AAFY20_00465 [Cyanobacteria bacterium J06639_14]